VKACAVLVRLQRFHAKVERVIERLVLSHSLLALLHGLADLLALLGREFASLSFRERGAS
jgi:hypothetical protein